MNSLLPTTIESRDKTDNHDIYKINNVLENEDLVRKEVSEEHDSLFRAFSDGLYFTPIYYHQIKDQLIRYLSNLITTNTIPPKLGIFRGNSVLWNDYSRNPSCSEFMNINIELFSLVFSVRVVVYTVTMDGNLTAKIFNNKFHKSVEFINTNGTHLDVIHSKKSIQIIGACQDIVLNLVDMVIEGKKETQEYEWKDFNNEQYITSWLRSAASSQEVNKAGESSNSTDGSKTQYKRTKSDSDLKSLQTPSSDQLQSYNVFVDSKPSEEISKIVQKDVSGLKNTINLSLVNESGLTLGEKSNISEGSACLGLVYRKSFPNQKRTVQSDDDEDLMPPESTSLSKSKSFMDANQSARRFTNLTPPGLTPVRYSTKTYGNENFTQAAMNDSQPTRHRHSENFGYSHNLLHDQPQPGFAHQNKARTTPRNIGQPTNTEDLTRAQGNGHTGTSTQGSEASHQISRAANPRTSEKKKPVIIDESQHRFTGKLKFFDEGKSYGFIVMDDDGSDIFVHLDDLIKANISKDALKAARFGNAIRLSFNSMEYIGKYNKSRKATDIQLLA